MLTFVYSGVLRWNFNYNIRKVNQVLEPKKVKALCGCRNKAASSFCVAVVLGPEPWHIRPIHKALVHPHDPLPEAMFFFVRLKTVPIQAGITIWTRQINASDCLLVLLFMLLNVGVNKQGNVVRMAGKKLGGLGGSMEISFTCFCYSVEEEKREPGLLLQTQYFSTCLRGK